MVQLAKAIEKTKITNKANTAFHNRPAFLPNSCPTNRILNLQRNIGKHAVQRLLRSGTLQAKLKIGQPGDRYEQEADRVANAVMRMPEPGQASISEKSALINPECLKCDEELHRKPLEEEEEKLQTKTASDQVPELNAEQEAHINGLQGKGQPLPESVSAFFEPRFGYDFSQVRVHTDAKAAEAVNARAFTLGNSVVFGEGEYAPETSSGRRLIAHELTHIIQQGSGIKAITAQPVLQRLPFGITLPSGVRGLDPAEEGIARPVYGSSLKYGDVYLSDAVGGGGRPYTTYVPLLGTVINIGPAAYATPGSDPSLLIHEMAHSWQSQHHSSPAAFMGNSIASQVAAAAAGGSAYCYIPGRSFGAYGAEQIAQQVENGEAPIISHISSVSAGATDAANVAGLSLPHWETPGAPGVRC